MQKTISAVKVFAAMHRHTTANAISTDTLVPLETTRQILERFTRAGLAVKSPTSRPTHYTIQPNHADYADWAKVRLQMKKTYGKDLG